MIGGEPLDDVTRRLSVTQHFLPPSVNPSILQPRSFQLINVSVDGLDLTSSD